MKRLKKTLFHLLLSVRLRIPRNHITTVFLLRSPIGVEREIEVTSVGERRIEDCEGKKQVRGEGY